MSDLRREDRTVSGLSGSVYSADFPAVHCMRVTGKPLHYELVKEKIGKGRESKRKNSGYMGKNR